jgi:hypothetical protein
MRIEDIRIVGGPLARASEAELSHLEETLGTRFPSGYRQYMTILGECTLGASGVRVYPPWKILDGVTQVAWRDRIIQYWNWGRAADVLTKARALECVILGDKLSGDEFVFHRMDPDRLFVLPQRCEEIHVIGPGLLPALESLSAVSGSEGRAETFKFTPTGSRAELPYNDAREVLVSALRRNASLHVDLSFGEMSDGYEDLSARMPRDPDRRFDKLRLALNFWRAWLDAAEHGWLFHDPFVETDWPLLAGRIADDLNADREILDVRLLKHFGR